MTTKGQQLYELLVIQQPFRNEIVQHHTPLRYRFFHLLFHVFLSLDKFAQKFNTSINIIEAVLLQEVLFFRLTIINQRCNRGITFERFGNENYAFRTPLFPLTHSCFYIIADPVGLTLSTVRQHKRSHRRMLSIFYHLSAEKITQKK